MEPDEEGHRPVMRNGKRVAFIVILGIFAAFIVLTVQRYIVRAARVEHAVAPAPYFPPGSIWTKDISHEEVDPQSTEIINWLADAGGWGNHNRMQVDFSLRIMTANASTPQVRYRKPPNCCSADQDVVATIPLPPDGGVEGETNYRCNGGDCHLLIVDRSEGKLYELYGADYADNALTSMGLTVWDLNRIYPPSGRGDQCSSADSAGTPIAPLLFNANEIAAGSINHAMRLILPNDRIRAHVFVHPATHAGAPQGPDLAPPIGALFRLKANFDMSKLSPPARVVARAMQKYGLYLVDGGNIALTAESDMDTKIKYADLGFDSHSTWPIEVSNFEIVKMPPPITLTYECKRNK